MSTSAADSTIGGSVTHAASVTAAAATVTTTTASRQPHSSLIAAVSGLPTTSASVVPTYTAVVARPVCVAGTSRAPIGAITDHISPWVTAHSTRPPASTAKLGASAEISWDAVKQTRVSISVRRRGQCAVNRTNGTVVTAATRA